MRHGIADQDRAVSTPGTSDQGDDRRRARRLEAFPQAVRDGVLKVVGNDPRLEDLADSFPALLFALSTGYASPTARRTATRAVIAGQPLRAIAEHLGLPFWLRRLPAQALQRPLAKLPADPALSGRLASLVPPQVAAAGAWLDRLSIASRITEQTGRSDLLLWTAQQYRGGLPQPTAESFLRTQAWCWFAGQQGLRGAQLLSTRWSPGLGARRAAQEAALWAQRIELDACLGNGIRDTWLIEGSSLGYQFVALRNADDFIAEAVAMDNCLDRYAERLANRAVRVFSIRRDGRSVANVEISGHDRELGLPAIAQLRAVRNRRASMDVWQATYAWLGGQPIRPALPGLRIKATPARLRKALDAIWRPFLDLLPDDARIAFESDVLPAAPRRRSPAGTVSPRLASEQPASSRPASPRRRLPASD